ncbi:hypothetical protein ANAPH2_01470 [Anaplasma phagocytophilum]|nr:hypothetical protein ANAPH2_01470 [Anaplasma phagocytophilum]
MSHSKFVMGCFQCLRTFLGDNILVIIYYGGKHFAHQSNVVYKSVMLGYVVMIRGIILVYN